MPNKYHAESNIDKAAKEIRRLNIRGVSVGTVPIQTLTEDQKKRIKKAKEQLNER